jgi:hypothetical protein
MADQLLSAILKVNLCPGSLNVYVSSHYLFRWRECGVKVCLCIRLRDDGTGAIGASRTVWHRRRRRPARRGPMRWLLWIHTARAVGVRGGASAPLQRACQRRALANQLARRRNSTVAPWEKAARTSSSFPVVNTACAAESGCRRMDLPSGSAVDNSNSCVGHV